MIIGLTGPNGSGKTEVANYLRKKGFEFFSLSDIIRDKIKEGGETPTRDKMIQTGNYLRKRFGPSILAKLVIKRIKSQKVVIDSIRNFYEVLEFRKNLPEFILVGIAAPAKIRYQRLKRRKRIGDPLTLKEFIKKEKEENKLEPFLQQINLCMKMVDKKIINNGSTEDLYRKIDKLINYSARPSWDEYFLKMAFLVAERSTCLRHHMGAVIVKERRILTTGYNGAISGADDCLKLGCLRDELKIPSGTRQEICRAVHAEQNAIIQAGLHGVDIKEATMYCTHTPCVSCAKMIANAKIKRYVTCSEYADKEFLKVFKEAKIKFKKLPLPPLMISMKK